VKFTIVLNPIFTINIPGIPQREIVMTYELSHDEITSMLDYLVKNAKPSDMIASS
jgi:hypothetical protein